MKTLNLDSHIAFQTIINKAIKITHYDFNTNSQVWEIVYIEL